MDNGWIKIHRKVLDNPVVMKDADHLAIWVYLLVHATHKDHKTMFGGKVITLHPGQLVTGRKKIAHDLRVNEHKVERVLKLFKSEHQIEQRASNQGTVISIVRWDDYQNGEQQNEQQVSNERATSEQRASTKQEWKNEKNGKKERNIYTPAIAEIVDYLNQMTGKHYKPSTRKTRELITARLHEGFTVDDCKTVIWKKAREWRGTEWEKYIRPETLFGTKFEGYLNQSEAKSQEGRLDWIDELQRVHEEREAHEVNMA